MKYQRLRGTEDILVPETRIWQEIEKVSRDLFELFGYEEIRTPIIEPLGLFQRSIGESTDIVEKEIFQFQDKSKRKICLRPEATASIVRAYIENGLFQKSGLLKLYYLGPMFRAERPQRGRKRQFHQIGIEAIGSSSPILDVEVIYLFKIILDNLGITDFGIEINTLGCKNDKDKISVYLKNKIEKHLSEFCPQCQRRFQRNVLRIMDCKNQSCKEVLRSLDIDIKSVICKECILHYQKVKELLTSIGISFKENKYLVRGLDYYTRTVFEFLSFNLGAQNAIGAGGRYDDLIQELGGRPTEAVGFAFGIERVALLLPRKNKVRLSPDVFLVLQDRAYIDEGFKLIIKLREEGIRAEMDYQGRSLKSQMRLANEKGTKYVLILGKDEWDKGEISLKNMETGKQFRIRKQDVIETIKRR